VSAPKHEQWLHLFTSTIRPLYISDAIDVLASPSGSHIRFRYEKVYVEPRLQRDWAVKGRLIGRRVLVHFAIQHPAEYHQPSYIPIREATVVGHFVEGQTYVINFSTGPIRLAARTRELVDSDVDGEIGLPVRSYSQELRKRLVEISDPPRPSAISGPSLVELLEAIPDSGDELERSQGSDFESAVKIFSQALYFAPRVFFRIASINKQGEGDGERVPLTDGRLILTAGRRYEISISHYQRQLPGDGTHLTVTLPDGLTLLGDQDLAISSRYDVIPVEVYAGFRDDRVEGQLSVAIAPPELGPSVNIPVVIKPSKVASVVVPSAGVAAGSASAASSLLVATQGMKIGLAAAGAAVAGFAVMYRRARRLS
jgi:hypothetical protein